jgi:hypothetical protein
MNCLEFRRRRLAEPNLGGQDFLQHEIECKKCARFVSEMRELDARLSEALRIGVPVGLERQIKRRHRELNPGRPGRHILSLAASVLVSVGITTGIFYVAVRPPPPQAAVRDHIEKEWESIVKNDEIDSEATAAVLSKIGGMVRDDQGRIKYASLCDFSDYGSAHLVIDGRKGPVLVLIMKEQHVAKARFMAKSKPGETMLEGMHTHTSNGSMAIVGQADEELHTVGEFVRNSVFWVL